ncbi:M16 family metallopeptidase [Rhodococcus sp. NPDC078407]|uniref:M16 family metallopeptidase n=1 Tax=Rhodococcus sp. NPDC078407 TaxID=3364509 RepID=UPI0037C4F9C3
MSASPVRDVAVDRCVGGVTPTGLRVVAQHVPGSRCVGVTLVVGCGFVDERVGQAGYAHLIEHLLHQWSTGPGGDFLDAQVHRRGGMSNSRTYRHHTEYTAVAPASEVIWTSASHRLVWPRLDDEAVAAEVRVIAREVDEVTLDRPLGAFPWLQLPDALFTSYRETHDPFTKTAPVTGSEDGGLRELFERTYTPGRAVLAVVGAIEPDAVLADLDAARVESTDAELVATRVPVDRCRSDLPRHLVRVDGRLPGTARAEARELDLPRDISWRAAAMVAAEVLSEQGGPTFSIGLFGPLRGPDCSLLVGTELTPLSPVSTDRDRGVAVTSAVERAAEHPPAYDEIERARGNVRFAIESEFAGCASHSAFLAREQLFGYPPNTLLAAVDALDLEQVVAVLSIAANSDAGSVTITGRAS